jgi:hypothetical protein
MKQFNYIFILFITSFTISCYGTQTYGFITREIINNNITERSTLGYVSDGQSYTSGIEGIIFTYPTNFFTTAPIVQLSILQNIPHSTTEAYVAEVSANSINSTTVMVYHISSGVVSEAPTGVVTVCLFAVDDPNSPA